ncbi:carbohydrate ABC transporter permease [Occultella aeris]|uniref:L-arabinose transport system permease protein AraQ n=1 Tax=Occultella aeris TaxID=2761496 RepID=A0A7M4DDR6_9MICO|nr:carbohydrate ABC transporter permease [Occultella aeris]VZO34986.1 L-arabinose transport system permease protein AraQ [Occultella aeris]
MTGTTRHRTLGSRPGASSWRTSRLFANVLTYAFLIAGGLLMLGPFVFSAMTAVKTPKQFNTTWPLTLPAPATVENFTALFSEQYNFVVPIAVTAQVVLVLVLGQMLTSILAAYAFAQLSFPGRDTLFWVYLSTLMIPAVVTIIPLYSMMTTLGLKNSFAGLVVPFLFGSPYAIFLLRESFRSTPSDVLDAAKIDGAGVLRRLWQVMVPMNKPILATLLLITVVSQWNNFMWPLIIAPAPEWNVITVATAALQTQYNGNWTLVMAATTIALAPLVILFLVFQKQITSSLGVTGVR